MTPARTKQMLQSNKVVNVDGTSKSLHGYNIKVPRPYNIAKRPVVLSHYIGNYAIGISIYRYSATNVETYLHILYLPSNSLGSYLISTSTTSTNINTGVWSGIPNDDTAAIIVVDGVIKRIRLSGVSYNVLNTYTGANVVAFASSWIKVGTQYFAVKVSTSGDGVFFTSYSNNTFAYNDFSTYTATDKNVSILGNYLVMYYDNMLHSNNSTINFNVLYINMPANEKGSQVISVLNENLSSFNGSGSCVSFVDPILGIGFLSIDVVAAAGGSSGKRCKWFYIQSLNRITSISSLKDFPVSSEKDVNIKKRYMPFGSLGVFPYGPSGLGALILFNLPFHAYRIFLKTPQYAILQTYNDDNTNVAVKVSSSGVIEELFSLLDISSVSTTPYFNICSDVHFDSRYVACYNSNTVASFDLQDLNTLVII